MREFTAREAILYGTSNEKEFWSSGKELTLKLRKFVDHDSIVLDVGCGMGRVEKYLAAYCKEIFAIDISSRIIKLPKST